MGRALLEAVRPRMWDIEAGSDGPGSETVRIGKRRVRLADVQSVAIQDIHDRNTQGLMLGAMMFVCFAGGLAYYVFDAGGMHRLLIGSAFLSFLSAAGLFEMRKLKRLSLYELYIGLKSGELVTITSADRADIEALALRLAAGAARPD
jgi:Family of unknown function (DUF6232)